MHLQRGRALRLAGRPAARLPRHAAAGVRRAWGAQVLRSELRGGGCPHALLVWGADAPHLQRPRGVATEEPPRRDDSATGGAPVTATKRPIYKVYLKNGLPSSYEVVLAGFGPVASVWLPAFRPEREKVADQRRELADAICRLLNGVLL